MTLTDLTALDDGEINRRVAALEGVTVSDDWQDCPRSKDGEHCACADHGAECCHCDRIPPLSPSGDLYATSWDAAIGAWQAKYGPLSLSQIVFIAEQWLHKSNHIYSVSTPRDLCHALLLAAGDK